MRMEEIGDGKYIKNTDQVERYLLGLVENFIKTKDIENSSSRESIIKQAVQRMKEEVTFDNLGVLSITLPDGEKRVGAVNITLEDLNGEPKIQDKKSAFNVSFGTEKGTACQGDDPRLSDKREPLKHTHTIEEINGLQGKLSSLNNIAQRNKELNHFHNNKDILDKIIYNGDNSTIDLTVIDDTKKEINNIINNAKTEIENESNEIKNNINQINNDFNLLKEKIKTIKDNQSNKNNQQKIEVENHIEQEISKIKEYINNKTNSITTKEEIELLNNKINNLFSIKKEISLLVSDIIQNNTYQIEIENNDILDIKLKYTSVDKIILIDLPYCYIKDNNINIIQYEILSNNSISFSIDESISEEIKQGEIIIKIYSNQINE